MSEDQDPGGILCGGLCHGAIITVIWDEGTPDDTVVLRRNGSPGAGNLQEQLHT